MKAVLSLIVGIVVLFALQTAGATVLYSYTGNTLVPTTGSAPSSLGRITFAMTGDLGPNRMLDELDDPTPGEQFFPQSWTISDGVHTLSSSQNLPHLNSYFVFATNATGEITDWYVQIPTFDDDTLISLLLRTTNSPTVAGGPNGPPNAYDQSQRCSAISCDFKGPGDFEAFGFGQPGTWAMTTITAISEPATVALLLFGLAGVGCRRRSPITR